MLTLNDGRKELYQWDTGRTATVDIDCDVVHFANLKYGESLAVEVKEGKVAIPNKLLMSGEPIYCWAFVKDEGGAYTKKEQTFVVAKRAKPSDYVYTETETLTWKSLDERITELEKGGTGGSDAVKYTEQYLTDEQKAQARTNIGAVSVDEVPIATNDVAGVVKPVSKTDGMTQPVGVDENGVLFTVPPGGSGDMQKSVYDPNNKAKDIFKYADDASKLAVTNHALSDTAHTDIRVLISGLTGRLNALADSDDTTLDQLSEIVAYIKSNKSLIDAITTSKVSVSDIIDNMTTNVANKPLSAAQGVALKALIDGIVIPDKLPNPNALIFTGAVTGTYDGSEPMTVNIPSGGSGSGAEKTWSLLLDETLSEDTAYIFQDLSAPVTELIIEFLAGGDGTHRDVTIFNRQGVGYGKNIATFKNVLRSDTNVTARFVIHCVAFPSLAFFRCQYNNHNQSVGDNIINASSALLFDNEPGAFNGSANFDCISIGCWGGGKSGVFKAGTRVKVYGKI